MANLWRGLAKLARDVHAPNPSCHGMLVLHKGLVAQQLGIAQGFIKRVDGATRDIGGFKNGEPFL